MSFYEITQQQDKLMDYEAGRIKRGWTRVGTIKRTGEYLHEVLWRLPNGVYLSGAGAVLRALNQREVRETIENNPI